jgi:hypothetical protein
MVLLKHLTSWFLLCLLMLLPSVSTGGEPPPDAEKLLKAGQLCADKKYYLEALDVLEKARDILEASDGASSVIYTDVMFAIAETKIKARLHQDFPANYVKTALQDVQAANKLRERLPGILPQRLAEGYYLEGYIHKRFFMRRGVAKALFERAKSIDPTLAAAKRELSELLTSEEQNKAQ